MLVPVNTGTSAATVKWFGTRSNERLSYQIERIRNQPRGLRNTLCNKFEEKAYTCINKIWFDVGGKYEAKSES